MTPASPRLNMVLGQIITNRVLDKRVLHALMAVPREYFVPENLLRAAYADEDLPISDGRFLLAPLPFAQMLAVADIQPGEKVLDVGCGNGYSTAVLAHLAKEAVGCESNRELAETARRNLNAVQIPGARIVQVNNLAEGYTGDAPYDAIIINGSIQQEPTGLLRLLREGGRLIAARQTAPAKLGAPGGLGVLVEYRSADGRTHCKEHGDIAVPLLPGFERNQSFTL